MSTEHRTFVKFTGSGHRAHCSEVGCRFVGQNHSMIRLMAQGRTQAMAWHTTKMQAEEDARQHRRAELRKPAP